MKSALILTVLLIAFVWAGHLIFPWWYVAILAFAFGGLTPYKSGFSAFLSAFFAVGLVWLFSVYMIDTANESILSTRMADLMGLGNSLTLMLFTAFTGGVLGGLFCLSGYSFKRMVELRPKP